jgi:hypothetical protein
MYGYRIKHAILEGYMDRLLKDTPKDKQIDVNHFVKLREFSKSFNGRKDGFVAQYIAHMTLEGYLTMKDIPAEKDMEVSITPRGMNAALSEIFKIKQHEFLWKAIMNILMTAATVIVATVASIALSKDTTKLKSLEERLRKLEGVKDTTGVKASPNIVHL